MKPVLAALAVTAVFAPAAHAQILLVEDPTPEGTFSGSYQSGYDEDGNPTYGHQDGYIAVYEDGVVACNGNPTPLPYDQNGDGHDDAVQGYIWLGRGHQASGDIWPFEAGAGLAGGGSNHGKYSGEPTGDAPCEEADPEGDGPG